MRVYLDNNATTKMDKEVLDAMMPYLTDYFGNSSSLHLFGKETNEALTSSRAKIANYLGATPDEIIFTASGSEADNLAIRGVARAYKHRGKHIITSPIEHPAVKNTLKDLEEDGFEITTIPVDSNGLLDIEALKKSIKEDTISHAYLFQGEEGIGKKKLSYAFSKALLCTGEGDKPCNLCDACRRFDNGNSPDFFHIAPVKNMIRIPEIEMIQKEMTTAPINSDKKVVLVEDAHLMNKESNNKFLKTLEEPPSFVHIILTSSQANKLLPTIISRVQIINFFPVPNRTIQDLLVEQYDKTEDQAKFITEFTKGAIGKSIDLSKDDSLFEIREEVLKVVTGLINGDKTKVFNSIYFFNKHEEEIDELLDIMIYYFRDILIYKKLGGSSLIINKDKISSLENHSFMDFNRISDIILNIMETKDIIKKNINYNLAIEAMLLNI